MAESKPQNEVGVRGPTAVGEAAGALLQFLETDALDVDPPGDGAAVAATAAQSAQPVQPSQPEQTEQPSNQAATAELPDIELPDLDAAPAGEAAVQPISPGEDVDQKDGSPPWIRNDVQKLLDSITDPPDENKAEAALKTLPSKELYPQIALLAAEMLYFQSLKAYNETKNTSGAGAAKQVKLPDAKLQHLFTAATSAVEASEIHQNTRIYHAAALALSSMAEWAGKQLAENKANPLPKVEERLGAFAQAIDDVPASAVFVENVLNLAGDMGREKISPALQRGLTDLVQTINQDGAERDGIAITNGLFDRLQNQFELMIGFNDRGEREKGDHEIFIRFFNLFAAQFLTADEFKSGLRAAEKLVKKTETKDNWTTIKNKDQAQARADFVLDFVDCFKDLLLDDVSRRNLVKLFNMFFSIAFGQETIIDENDITKVKINVWNNEHPLGDAAEAADSPAGPKGALVGRAQAAFEKLLVIARGLSPQAKKEIVPPPQPASRKSEKADSPETRVHRTLSNFDKFFSETNAAILALDDEAGDEAIDALMTTFLGHFNSLYLEISNLRGIPDSYPDAAQFNRVINNVGVLLNHLAAEGFDLNGKIVETTTPPVSTAARYAQQALAILKKEQLQQNFDVPNLRMNINGIIQEMARNYPEISDNVDPEETQKTINEYMKKYENYLKYLLILSLQRGLDISAAGGIVPPPR